MNIGSVTKKEIELSEVDDGTDILKGRRHTIKIHKHGFISLVDIMPRIAPLDAHANTVDFAVVRAARVSMGNGLDTPEKDEALIRYLMRHKHTSPFEMVECLFHVSLPIFVARQWIRHRTANVNEISARYTELDDNYYLPGTWRKQGKSNKQGGEEPMEYASGKYQSRSDQTHCEYEDAIDTLIEEGNGSTSKDIHNAANTLIRLRDENPRMSAEDIAIVEYRRALEAGVSRELARMCLPVSMYTQWYWKCDLNNILKFLSLRRDGHAQLEIREYADAMYDLLLEIAPVTMQAWNDYHFEAMTLSRLEIEDLQYRIEYQQRATQAWMKRAMDLGAGRHDCVELQKAPWVGSNVRENDEWKAKLSKLGVI